MLSLYRTEDEMFLFPNRPNDNFDKVIVLMIILRFCMQIFVWHTESTRKEIQRRLSERGVFTIFVCLANSFLLYSN